MAEAEVEDKTESEGHGPKQDEHLSSSKKPRKRCKKICAQIRNQMEFYFSDANIHKDRFMKQAITVREDGYVPLSMFTNFNKLRQITTDMKLLPKALSTSKLLEVSEGKDLVRRCVPYEEPKDVDDRTLYVECLPKEVDHEWLKQTFSEYGTVVYVSLPRYKSTGDVKGFAFIEFDKAESVDRVCQSLPPVDPDSEKGSRFPKFNKQLQTLQKQINLNNPGEKGDERRIRRRRNTSEGSGGDSTDAPASKRSKSLTEPGMTENKAKKCISEEQRKAIADESEKATETVREHQPRKRSANEQEEGNENKRVRTTQDVRKTEDESEKVSLQNISDSDKTGNKEEMKEVKDGESKDNKADVRIEEKEGVRGVMVDPAKRKRLSDVGIGEAEGREVKRVRISEQVEVKENVIEIHKKRRKRNKKKKEHKERTEEVHPQIKVIPKTTWLHLRDEYLQLQKSSMKNLKKSLKTVRKSQAKAEHDPAVPMGSYMTCEEKEAKSQAGKLAFTPGVIVKVESLKPFVRKELKDTLSLVAAVPYVDLQDGDHKGYVRCATPEDALRILASNPSSYNVNLLQGEDEQTYWKKIEVDRENKRAMKTRSNKRGSQKLIARAEQTVATTAPRKHIVFDD